MIADDRIKNYNYEVANLQTSQVVEIYARLVELFGEMKQQHPTLERLHIGMGTFTISGKYTCQCFDYASVKEEYPELKILKDKIFENGQEWVVYEDLADNYDELIQQIIDGRISNAMYDAEHIDYHDFTNDAAIEFVELCNYIQEINYTTLFDGVNENGVIVSYGRGSHLDTYVDAKESEEVELLHNAGIPIVFYDITHNEYYNYVHFVE